MKATNISDEIVFSILRPRDPESNKGSYGTLTCVCGSRRFPGAASLSVMAALRCGAGIVRLMSTEPVVRACSSKVSEAIYETLEESVDGGISESGIPLISKTAEKSSAVLCGCGMGNTGDTEKIVLALLKSGASLILDADALNSIAASGRIYTLKRNSKPAVITPHVGEMSRLTGMSISDIKADPVSCAAFFAETYGCVVVLKDHVTCVAPPDGRVYMSTAGNAGLARGGSGDTLAGMIASFLAQGYPPLEAALCGVHLHGSAADRCAARLSQYGMLPSDILTDLCGIFLERGL